MISVIFNATVQHGAYAYHIVLAKIVQIGFLTWQSEDLHILSVFFIQIYLSSPCSCVLAVFFREHVLYNSFGYLIYMEIICSATCFLTLVWRTKDDMSSILQVQIVKSWNCEFVFLVEIVFWQVHFFYHNWHESLPHIASNCFHIHWCNYLPRTHGFTRLCAVLLNV